MILSYTKRIIVLNPKDGIAMMLEEMQNEELRRVAIEQVKLLAGVRGN